jgi:hypothetical protein
MGCCLGSGWLASTFSGLILIIIRAASTTPTAITTATISAWTAWTAWTATTWPIMTWRACAFIRILVLVNPALYANNSINGLGFRESIVDWDAKSLERHLAFTIPFSTSDISTTKATGAADTNSVSPEVHGSLNSALHRTTESNSAFELDDYLLTDALGIELRLADLNNINLDL